MKEKFKSPQNKNNDNLKDFSENLDFLNLFSSNLLKLLESYEMEYPNQTKDHSNTTKSPEVVRDNLEKPLRSEEWFKNSEQESDDELINLLKRNTQESSGKLNTSLNTEATRKNEHKTEQNGITVDSKPDKNLIESLGFTTLVNNLVANGSKAVPSPLNISGGSARIHARSLEQNTLNTVSQPLFITSTNGTMANPNILGMTSHVITPEINELVTEASSNNNSLPNHDVLNVVNNLNDEGQANIKNIADIVQEVPDKLSDNLTKELKNKRDILSIIDDIEFRLKENSSNTVKTEETFENFNKTNFYTNEEVIHGKLENVTNKKANQNSQKKNIDIKFNETKTNHSQSHRITGYINKDRLKRGIKDNSFSLKKTENMALINGSRTENMALVNGTSKENATQVNGTRTENMTLVNVTTEENGTLVYGIRTENVALVNGTRTENMVLVNGTGTENMLLVNGSGTENMLLVNGTGTENAMLVNNTKTENMTLEKGIKKENATSVNSSRTENVAPSNYVKRGLNTVSKIVTSTPSENAKAMNKLENVTKNFSNLTTGGEIVVNSAADDSIIENIHVPSLNNIRSLNLSSHGIVEKFHVLPNIQKQRHYEKPAEKTKFMRHDSGNDTSDTPQEPINEVTFSNVSESEIKKDIMQTIDGMKDIFPLVRAEFQHVINAQRLEEYHPIIKRANQPIPWLMANNIKPKNKGPVTVKVLELKVFDQLDITNESSAEPTKTNFQTVPHVASSSENNIHPEKQNIFLTNDGHLAHRRSVKGKYLYQSQSSC